MKQILSTLSAPNAVCITRKLPNGNKAIVKRIIVKGGANVADKKTLVTPRGVITELQDADFDILKGTDWFKRMESRGFVRVVETKSAAEDPEKAGMKKKDKAAQKTKKDIADADKVAKAENAEAAAEAAAEEISKATAKAE